MTLIYCLMHSYDNQIGEPEDKILGYFDSKKKALAAKDAFMNLPGFSSHKDSFIVDEIELGKLNWIEGFETIIDNQPI